MDNIQYLATVGSLLVGGILLVSGVAHARSLRGFVKLIREQGVLPGKLAPFAAALCIVTEIIASVLLLSGIWRSTAAAGVGTVLAGALITAFIFYSVALLRTPQSVACGCLGGSHPTNAAVPVRAGLLLLLLVPAALESPWPLPSSGVVPGTITLVSSLALGLLLALLPAAMDFSTTEENVRS